MLSMTKEGSSILRGFLEIGTYHREPIQKINEGVSHGKGVIECTFDRPLPMILQRQQPHVYQIVSPIS